MSRLMPTSASRHSEGGHRKTTAPFWVQKQFHILQQSPWALPEPLLLAQCLCSGTLAAAAAALLFLLPAPACALAAGWACLLWTRTSRRCLTEHVPVLKMHLLVPCCLLWLVRCISLQALLPSAAGPGFHLFLIRCAGHSPLPCASRQ